MSKHLENRVGRSGRRALTAVVIAAACSVGASVEAASHQWVGNNSGNFSEPANWVGGLVPVSGNETVIEMRPTASAAVTANNDLEGTLTAWLFLVTTNSTGTTTINGNPLRFVLNPNQTTFPFAGLGSDGPATAGPLVINNDVVIDAPEVRLVSGVGTAGLVLNGALLGTGRAASQGQDVQYNGLSPNFQGKLDVISGTLTLGPNAFLGPDVRMLVSNDFGVGRLVISSADNLAADGQVSLRRAYFEPKQVSTEVIQRLSPPTGGALAITPTSQVNPSISLENHPGLTIAVSHPATAGVVELSAAIAPGNDTYRFGGNNQTTPVPSGAQPFEYFDTLHVSSDLTDNFTSGAARSLVVGTSGVGSGGKVKVTNPFNSYSGGTFVESNRSLGTQPYLLIDFTPGLGHTPLGMGPVTVAGALLLEGADGALGSLHNEIIFRPGSELLLNNVQFNVATNSRSTLNNFDRWPDARTLDLNGTRMTLRSLFGAALTEDIGALSYEGSSQVLIDNSGSGTTTLRVDSVARRGRGTLLLFSNTTTGFGTGRRFQADDYQGLVDPVTGMVHPSIISDNSSTSTFGIQANFLRVDGSGVFLPITAYATAYNPASDSEIVATGTPSTVSADETVYALISRSTTIAAGRTLTIRSGGLILGDDDVLITGGSLAFVNNGVPVEGLIYSRTITAAELRTPITSADGVTFFGDGDITLSAANSFTGPLTIHDGFVEVNHDQAIPPGAPVHVAVDAGLGLNGHSVVVGPLSGGGTISPGAVANQSATLTVDVPAGEEAEFAGRLIDRPPRSQILSLTKTGPGTLTLSGFNPLIFADPQTGYANVSGGYAGLTTVEQGTLILRETFQRYGGYHTHPGARLTFLTNHAIEQLTGEGDTAVASGIVVTASRIVQGSLELAAGARVQIRPAVGDAVPPVNRLSSVAIDNTARFDLADSSLIVQASDVAARDQAVAQLNGYVRSARNTGASGTWSGPGLATSAAADELATLAVIPNDDGSGNPLMSSLGGEGVDINSVLVMYTVTGDTDGDGRVGVLDFFRIDQGHALEAVGYHHGDYDYSGGPPDATDYVLIDRSFLAQSSAASSLRPVAPSDSVPEPGLAGLLLAAGPALARRRRPL